MEYPSRTIVEVRTPHGEHNGSMAHPIATSGYMQNYILNPQKQPAFRIATAKSILPHHNNMLCTRADRFVFQGQMPLRAMEAAPEPDSPKVSKTRNFYRKSFKNQKLFG